MQLLTFGPAVGRPVDSFGSRYVASPLLSSAASARLTAWHLRAGDEIREHAFALSRVLCVVSGEGWVSGADGVPLAIGAEQAAQWDAGERHAVGTETGLSALVLDGLDLELLARPAPPSSWTGTEDLLRPASPAIPHDE